MIEREPGIDHTEDIASIWDAIKKLRDGKCDMDVFEARLAKVDEYLDLDHEDIDQLKDKVDKGRSAKKGVELDALNIDGWNKTMELAYETDKKVDAILNEVGVGGFGSMKQSIQKI